MAWTFLKALPEHQVFSEYVEPTQYGRVGDVTHERHGTVHPAIRGMLQRRAGNVGFNEPVDPNENVHTGYGDDNYPGMFQVGLPEASRLPVPPVTNDRNEEAEWQYGDPDPMHREFDRSTGDWMKFGRGFGIAETPKGMESDFANREMGTNHAGGDGGIENPELKTAHMYTSDLAPEMEEGRFDDYDSFGKPKGRGINLQDMQGSAPQPFSGHYLNRRE